MADGAMPGSGAFPTVCGVTLARRDSLVQLEEVMTVLLFGLVLTALGGIAIRQLGVATAILGLWLLAGVSLHLTIQSDASFALMLLCSGVGAAAVLIANYRDHIVAGRLRQQLQDPKARRGAERRLVEAIDSAGALGDSPGVESSTRFAVELLAAAQSWQALLMAVDRAELTLLRPGFRRWLTGIRALSLLHLGQRQEAADALADALVAPEEHPWLASIDALRVALEGDGESALNRLRLLDTDIPAVIHHRQIAEVHALVSLGRHQEAQQKVETLFDSDPGVLESLLSPPGPASAMAARLAGPRQGPFRD